MDEEAQKWFRKSLSSPLSQCQDKQYFDPRLSLPGQHTRYVAWHSAFSVSCAIPSNLSTNFSSPGLRILRGGHPNLLPQRKEFLHMANWGGRLKKNPKAKENPRIKLVSQ